MSSDPNFDEELDEFKDLSALYRQGAAEQPSQELDASILAASREPIPQHHKSPWLEFVNNLFRAKYWPAATAFATVILVTVTLNIQMPVAEPDTLLTAPPIEKQKIQASEPIEIALPNSPQTPSITQPQETESKFLKARMPNVEIETLTEQGAADGDGPNSAEVWLRKIEQQLKDGKQDDARKLFYGFRQLYPNRKIPDDLLSRLGM
jgi:hypothetical protein